jgi:hypothetical protein
MAKNITVLQRNKSETEIQIIYFLNDYSFHYTILFHNYYHNY